MPMKNKRELRKGKVVDILLIDQNKKVEALFASIRCAHAKQYYTHQKKQIFLPVNLDFKKNKETKKRGNHSSCHTQEVKKKDQTLSVRHTRISYAPSPSNTIKIRQPSPQVKRKQQNRMHKNNRYLPSSLPRSKL